MTLLITLASAAITVNTLTDQSDDTLDGVCEATPGVGDCTLRAAVEESEWAAGAETIVLPASTFTLTLGELTILDELKISGQGATIDGNQDRIFLVDGGTLSLHHLGLTNGYADWGGAILMPSGRLQLSAVKAWDNEAIYQGGVIFLSTGQARIEDSKAANNEAQAGGFLSGGGTVTVHTSSFTDHYASSLGAVLANTGTLSVYKSTFEDNESWSSGGAITSQGDLVVQKSTFTNNESGFGGAIRSMGDTLEVTESSFTGNTANFSSGGGVSSNTPSLIDGCSFTGNTANWDGGGLHLAGLAGTRMQVLNSSVVGNQATDDGGGIYFGNSDHLLANTTVSYNSADEGGGIYAYVGNTTLEHASVTNNRAVTGGGLKSVGSGKTVSSSLIADNGASSSGRDCSGSVTSGGYSLVTTTNSCAWTSATGDQLNVSAGLAGLSTGTSPGHPAMTISSSSNALDAGGLCATYPNDQLGQARVGVCDIGAWEY